MNDDGTIRVRAKAVAVGAVVVGAACTITLIVVLSLGDADELAAVALTFGLVAFMAQLVIAVAQFGSAERAQSEAGRINADTQAALSELRRANEEIVASQRGVVDRLIGQALTSAQAQATSPEEAEAVERVRANLLGIVPTQTLPDPGADSRMSDLQEAFKAWVEAEGFEYVESPPNLDGAPVIKVGERFMVVDFGLGPQSRFNGRAFVQARTLRDQLIDQDVWGLQIWERGDSPLGATRDYTFQTIHAWPDVLSQVRRVIEEDLPYGGEVDEAEET